MAKMTIKGLDEYSKVLDKLGKDAPEIAKKVVYSGADVVADEVRRELTHALGDSEYSTGDLLGSLGIAPIDSDNRGNTNTKIGFDGYDRKGVPNALKARAMESGTSSQPKKPFMRRAVNRAKQRAIDEMGKRLDVELSIYALDKK